MKRAMWLLTGAVAVFSAVGLAAQAKPDFSGEWTRVEDPAPPPVAPATRPGAAPRAGDMGSGWGATITIAQGPNQLSVEYAFFVRGDLQPPLRFVYALDGSETRNVVSMGRGAQAQAAKTAWQGETLVITTVHAFDDPASGTPMTSEVRQAVSLGSPTMLIVETTRSGVLGGAASTTRTAYRKV